MSAMFTWFEKKYNANIFPGDQAAFKYEDNSLPFSDSVLQFIVLHSVVNMNSFL